MLSSLVRSKLICYFDCAIQPNRGSEHPLGDRAFVASAVGKDDSSSELYPRTVLQ